MLRAFALSLLLAASLKGCVAYEYEHEFWLRVDGSGTVNVTGRPALWGAFKGLGDPRDPAAHATREQARALFERSGLSVRRVTLTERQGQPYLFVSADFDDVNKLGGTPAFPDLTIGLRREGEHLVLEGDWVRPGATGDPGPEHHEGLMAVRFHLPSRVYAHKNAFEGVERGNITSWRQGVASALGGGKLEFGATLDSRSILGTTATLFAVTIGLGVSILAFFLWWAWRKGRREAAAGRGV
ncbi:MAG: hypothetical protein KJ067_01345 [Vicinamibacteria bacterium]|nr:hypothetical protein [Vicinamibacteria bacterium]